MEIQHKAASEIILEALRKFLVGEDSSGETVSLGITKLPIASHSRIIMLEESEAQPNDSTAQPFSHVKQVARYSKKLRQESWQ